MKKISEGAESIVYEGTVAGIRCVIKSRIQKLYRIDELDQRIRSTRTKNEARIISSASKAGVNTPRVLLIDGFDLYTERIGGTTLNKMGRIGTNERQKIMQGAGKNLALLHSSDIAHGDYTPANIMVDSGTVYVIDFGLAEQTKSVEEKAIDLLLMKRSVEKSDYKTFESAYVHASSKSNAIVSRLHEVEMRGRYQTRTLAV